MSVTIENIVDNYYQPGALDAIPIENIEKLSAEAWTRLKQVFNSSTEPCPDVNEICLLCDALRLCNRKVLTDSDLKLHEKLDSLLEIVRIFFVHDSMASTKALQCLVNLLINQPDRMKLFVSSNNAAKLCSLLNRTSSCFSERVLMNMQYVIKIMYMIKSCSSWLTIPNVSNEDHLQMIAICVFGLYQLLEYFKSEDSLTLLHSSLFCDACKLLYSMDCYSHLETESGPLFVLDQTNNVVLRSSCTEVECLPLPSVRVLNSVLFRVLMMVDSSSDSDSGVFKCQQAALQLCMLASQSTIDELLQSRDSDTLVAIAASSSSGSGDDGGQQQLLSEVVSRLCFLLQRLLEEAGQGPLSEDRQTHILSPVLVFYSKLVKNDQVRREFKSVIFPTPFMRQEGQQQQKSIDPSDVPEGSLRGLLIPLMISLNTQVKRCVSEFIYELCDSNADEFVFRTGFGNAVALLQIKGLLG